MTRCSSSVFLGVGRCCGLGTLAGLDSIVAFERLYSICETASGLADFPPTRIAPAKLEVMCAALAGKDGNVIGYHKTRILGALDLRKR